MEAAVAAAILMAIGASIAALVNWLNSRDVRRLTTDHEKELATLKSDLGRTEERLRHDLSRELVTHESALRVRGEVELQLFEKAATSTAKALHGLLIWADGLDKFRRGGQASKEDFDVLKTLSQVGLFLPPELDEPFDAARDQIRQAALEFAGARAAKAPDVDAIGLRMSARILQVRKTFERQAREWKRSHWARLTNKAGGDDAQ